jgi:hypothetical protein
VAEHARNAGDSLYLLTAMGGDAASGLTPGPIHRARVADVVARPEGWLLERSPVMVGR